MAAVFEDAPPLTDGQLERFMSVHKFFASIDPSLFDESLEAITRVRNGGKPGEEK